MGWVRGSKIHDKFVQQTFSKQVFIGALLGHVSVFGSCVVPLWSSWENFHTQCLLRSIYKDIQSSKPASGAEEWPARWRDPSVLLTHPGRQIALHLVLHEKRRCVRGKCGLLSVLWPLFEWSLWTFPTVLLTFPSPGENAQHPQLDGGEVYLGSWF